MTIPNKMKLPGDALSEQSDNDNTKILNPIFDKKYLTINEVLNCINHLSAVLLANECYKSQAENKRYL